MCLIYLNNTSIFIIYITYLSRNKIIIKTWVCFLHCDKSLVANYLKTDARLENICFILYYFLHENSRAQV